MLSCGICICICVVVVVVVVYFEVVAIGKGLEWVLC